jgi:hypothetical protein
VRGRNEDATPEQGKRTSTYWAQRLAKYIRRSNLKAETLIILLIIITAAAFAVLWQRQGVLEQKVTAAVANLVNENPPANRVLGFAVGILPG